MSKQRKLTAQLDNLFESMQEVYRDCDEQKIKILASIKNRQVKFPAGDYQEEGILGKLEIDSIKLLNDVIDKKVKILALHARIVGVKPETPTTSEQLKKGNAILTDDEIAALSIIAKNEQQRGKVSMTYDLNGYEK